MDENRVLDVVRLVGVKRMFTAGGGPAITVPVSQLEVLYTEWAQGPQVKSYEELNGIIKKARQEFNSFQPPLLSCEPLYSDMLSAQG